MFPRRRGVSPVVLAVGLALCGGTSLAQAAGWSKTIPATEHANVEIILRSGNVRAIGWDRAEIKVETTEATGPKIAASGKNIRIPADDDVQSFDGSLVVHLPRKARLRVSTMAGKISAEKLQGKLRLTSISEDVTAQDCPGPLTATSVSGSVLVERVGTQVELRSVSGRIDAKEVTGAEFEAKTVSGELRLRDVRVRSLRAKTLSGEMHLHLPAMPADGASAQTFSGEVNIWLPRAASFEIDARSSSGSVRVGFPLKATAQEGQKVRGTVGRGGPELRLRSFSGAIRVEPAK